MFAITITPVETPEETKTKLVNQARELLQEFSQLKIRADINLTWSANTAPNIEEYIVKLTAAIAQGNAQISDKKETKKQAELQYLREKAAALSSEAKQMRSSMSITHESQTTLLNLRLELEAALREDDPQPAVITAKIIALSNFVHPKPLNDEENTSASDGLRIR